MSAGILILRFLSSVDTGTEEEALRCSNCQMQHYAHQSTSERECRGQSDSSLQERKVMNIPLTHSTGPHLPLGPLSRQALQSVWLLCTLPGPGTLKTSALLPAGLHWTLPTRSAAAVVSVTLDGPHPPGHRRESWDVVMAPHCQACDTDHLNGHFDVLPLRVKRV